MDKLENGVWTKYVLPLHEIRATLDSDGILCGLDFCPEMQQYCGQEIQCNVYDYNDGSYFSFENQFWWAPEWLTDEPADSDPTIVTGLESLL